MINPVTKDLMHIVIDGKPELIPIMHQLHRFKDCQKILKWLFKNKITGKNLVDWLKVEHSNSVMGMVKFIVQKNNIVYGKDWSLNGR
jgi:hypothetical protein